jgi:hypothetical protein
MRRLTLSIVLLSVLLSVPVASAAVRVRMEPTGLSVFTDDAAVEEDLSIVGQLTPEGAFIR